MKLADESEANLLRRIGRRLPLKTQQRYDALTAKLHRETLTSAEHKELLVLVDQIELADAERMQALTELAQLRTVSVEDLVAELSMLRLSD
ncbi:MAG: hypothetical protein JXB30_11010 [Anaerolineae bacterium]|nr:hypothetical protein [Anaerolineae bacterium]